MVDDVLATGGTALAAASLVRLLGAELVDELSLELEFLHGRERLTGAPSVAISDLSVDASLVNCLLLKALPALSWIEQRFLNRGRTFESSRGHLKAPGPTGTLTPW